MSPELHLPALQMEVCTVERDQQALPREAYAAAERRSA
jgi:hypothetical protein